MKVQVIVLLAIISTLAADDSQFYCGRRLASALAALCYDDNLVKRSDMMRPDSEAYGYGIGYSYVSPWVAQRQAHSLHGGRGKRQVVSECCDKPCTIDEMMTYCSN